MFVDSHFHGLMMADKGMAVADILRNDREKGLMYALDIGILPEDAEKRLILTEDFPWIRHSAGIYPGGSKEDNVNVLLDQLEKLLAAGRFIAVGEMGIDLHWNYADTGKQRQLFFEQINLANRYKLPIIVHNRKADTEVLQLLREKPPEYGGIMHCFSSNVDIAFKCIRLGLLISFAGNVTYKNALEIRQAASSIPAESLLVETDAPYLSPQAVRGTLNRPGYITHTYSFLAEERKIDPLILRDAVKNNFLRLFPDFTKD